MRRTALLLAAVLFASGAKQNLPQLGTRFHPLPAGRGKTAVEASCYPCHSADLLVQQRLTEKQWVAEVDKMIRWGAKVPDKNKAAIVGYLSRNFGTDNKKFVPILTRPNR
jgi:hypothetical protein